jgi:hypothetical protein
MLDLFVLERLVDRIDRAAGTAAALNSLTQVSVDLGANQIQGCLWKAVLGVMERLVLSDAAWERMARLMLALLSSETR